MAKKKILLIDDENIMRKTVSLFLQHYDIDIKTAGNGEEGLTSMKNDKPDMVLLDIMMPFMDGWEVLRRIRSDEALKEIPVIMFTASDTHINEAMLRESGATGILHKPFHLQQLLAAVGISKEIRT